MSKAKKKRPSFDEFMEQLESIITSKRGKKRLNDVLACLKHGYVGQISAANIDSICNRFFGCEEFSFIALKIALSVSCGTHQPDLVKWVSRKLRQECGKRAQFPLDKTPLSTNVTTPERKEILKDWASSCLYRYEQEDAVNWARLAVVCLLNEDINEGDFEIIQYILKSISSKKGHQKKKRNKFAPYTLELCTPLLDQKVKIKKLKKIFELAELFEEKITDLSRHQRALVTRMEELREEVNTCHEQAEAMQQKLSEVEDRSKALQRDLELKDRQIRIEIEKFESSERHWQNELSRQLAGVIFSIKKKFSHEINEAILSIDGTRPDLQMALSRLRRMMDELRRLEEKWLKG